MSRTALATCAVLACFLQAHALRAQPVPVNAPVTPPPGPVNAPVPVATPASAEPAPAPEVPVPDESGAPAPAPSPCPTLVPIGTPGPFSTPVPCVPGTGPSATPGPPPIFVTPNAPSIVLGTTVTLRVDRAVGTIIAIPIDPNVVDVRIDQAARTIVVSGKNLGVTTIHVADERGVSAEVGIRVALLAGSVAPSASVRITGNPATAAFVRAQVAAAAIVAARPRAGANVTVTSVNVRSDLGQDDVTSVDVPVTIAGPDYITAQGTTHVSIENFALPRISPSQLLVSDYPETLSENGLLFAGDLTRDAAQRFLYYHFNPRGQPNRRILLKVENPSPQAAVVQFISGSAGPEENEMEVGHLSTRRFLVRELQNEGTVVTIPPNSTINLVNHQLPAGSISSAILQLREMTGNTLHLTLLAQDANDPIDTPVSQDAALLRSDVKHARGVYPVPEFFFDYTYDTATEPLQIQIGALKLPNMLEGEALAGDYGVMQSINVTIVNRYGHAVPIAIYENPRGGRATGTYLIDRVLVQSHAVNAYGHYMLRQYTVPANGFVRVQITTMPEGGSSYPLNLVVGPDDGSTAPGAPNSPIY